jgi:hypothetical protein
MTKQVSKFPEFTFPDQIVVDGYGIVYQYQESTDCFVRMGGIEDIPVSSFNEIGLMNSIHKGNLDLIPEKAGGFALVVEPLLGSPSIDNPDGLIYGDIELISDSLDITCKDVNGNSITSECYNCIDGKSSAGFSFQLGETFLTSFCAKLPSIPGPAGDKGETGEDGDPGTGDGPQGEQGDPGTSYFEAGTFTGVKILDVDGLYDEAVVDLDLDPDNGVLTVLKAAVRIGDETTPADQIITTPIIRDIEFNRSFPSCGEGDLNDSLWDYTLIKGNDNLDTDLYIYRLPDKYEPPGASEMSAVLLSDVVNAIIDDFKPIYESALEKYDNEIKAFILEKDEQCRQNICTLAKQLSECEWELPLEYCVGISPMDCGSSLGDIANSISNLDATIADVDGHIANIDATLGSWTDPGGGGDLGDLGGDLGDPGVDPGTDPGGSSTIAGASVTGSSKGANGNYCLANSTYLGYSTYINEAPNEFGATLYMWWELGRWYVGPIRSTAPIGIGIYPYWYYKDAINYVNPPSGFWSGTEGIGITVDFDANKCIV